MGRIYNLAKPYILLWGKFITWPSQISYVWKILIFWDPKTTNIFWKSHSHIQPQAIPIRQKCLFMDPLIKTFSKKIGLWQANYSQSGTFLWKPYFSYRAIWGLFTRDIPSPPSQWRRFGIPSGFFFPTKIRLFMSFNDKTWPQASGDALACPPGFFPHQNTTFTCPNMVFYYHTIPLGHGETASVQSGPYPWPTRPGKNKCVSWPSLQK